MGLGGQRKTKPREDLLCDTRQIRESDIVLGESQIQTTYEGAGNDLLGGRRKTKPQEELLGNTRQIRQSDIVFGKSQIQATYEGAGNGLPGRRRKTKPQKELLGDTCYGCSFSILSNRDLVI